MVNFTVDQIRQMMTQKHAIRNLSVIAHVDHGKSTLTDSLIARAGIIAGEKAGEARYTDTRQDEQERAITIKSTGVTLFYSINDTDLELFKNLKAQTVVDNKVRRLVAKSKKKKNKGKIKIPTEEEQEVAMKKVAASLNFGNEYLINLIDSPGHVDFSSEVTAALRITDGALVVCDATSGVCVQTETVLRQALTERIKPVLMINKLDRTVLELQLGGEETFQALQKIIENVNVIVSTYSDGSMGDVQVYPDHGTVAFGSGLHGWGFTLLRFARFYASKFGVKIEKFMKRLWGDWFWDTKKNKWTKKQYNADGVANVRGFDQFIWTPITKLFDAIMNEKVDIYTTMFETLGIVMKSGDKRKSGKTLLKTAMRYWLPAADALLEMIVLHLPSPADAQTYRCDVLYTGPLTDATAVAIKACDPEGPLCMYVSKMVPTSDRGRFYAFGRVFSGTIKSGQKVRIMGANFEHGGKEDLYVKNVPRTVLMMGRYVEAIPSVPCGNLVGIAGVDQYLVKTGTLSTDEEGYPMKTMAFSVSPVVRVAVEPVRPADLPKLVEGIRRLTKSDPCVLHIQEDSGEHVICTVGELHLEICMKDLRELSGIDVRQSEPVVSFRETVTALSSQSCLAKSPNKHNRLWVKAEQVDDKLITDMEELKVPSRDVKVRARYLVDTHGWDLNNARKIWTFGPGKDGSCMVIDQTKSIQYLNEIKEHVVNGFNWAARSGVLSEEDMRGVRFNLLDAHLHADSIHRGASQILPTARRCFYAAQLTAEPRYQEPVFKCEIQVHKDYMGGIFTVMSRRRGKIVSQDPKVGTPLVIINGFLPVAESFGFTQELRANTSGRAFPSMIFSHYALIDSDPLEEGSRGYEICMKARERKGLKAQLPDLAKYIDRM